VSDTPYTGQTDNPTVVGEYFFDLFDARAKDLGLDPEKGLFYGDQQLIPTTPTICVEPGPLNSILDGAPFVLLNTFTIYIMVYHSKVQDTQVTRKECDQYAYAIRKTLLEDKPLGGLVIYGFVTDIEPGYANRNGQLLRTSRITWQGQSKKVS
jgi:hypothetical protein